MNRSVTAYIDSASDWASVCRYTLKLISANQSLKIDLVDVPSEDVDIAIHFQDEAWNQKWVLTRCVGYLDHISQLGSRGDLYIESGVPRIELLPQIYYHINCCQEYTPAIDNIDRYGRYKYTSSDQYQMESITDNFVQSLIQQFVRSIGLAPKQRNTKLFISHDIDFLYGSKKEDLKWAAKNWRLGDLIKIIFNEFTRRPHWRNIDRVIAMNREYDIRSTFFWLVNEGLGLSDIPNADYTFRKETDLLSLVELNDGQNGLHKSASSMSINEEIAMSGETWNINRYHYLKFNIQEHWKEISDSNIQLDCSLGFAEHYGFRNSYGLPFQPFDLENDRPYNFVEAPLHVMDATFLHYLKTDPGKIGEEVIDFIEKNKTDCVLSILWHNNYCTDYAYKPFLKAYKEILSYIYENQFESITPDEIIKEYTLNWPS